MTHDCNTPSKIIKECSSIYVTADTRLIIKMQEQILDFKTWLDGYVNEFEHHAKLRAFKFELNYLNSAVECWYKKTHAGDKLWQGAREKEGFRVFHQTPTTEPQLLKPNKLDVKVCQDLPKLFGLLETEEQQWYNNLIAKEGDIFEQNSFIFKIDFSREQYQIDDSATTPQLGPILRVSAPAQTIVSSGDNLRVEKDDEIIFTNNDELKIARVTSKAVNNELRGRLFVLHEENINDPSENIFKISKETLKINIKDVKMAGSILTKKGYIRKRLWPKYKTWQSDLQSE